MIHRFVPSAKRLKSVSLAVAATISTFGNILALPQVAQAAEAGQRPPQFVLMAFDGSYNHAFWEDSRGFAKQMSAAGKPLKFTYFISGVYYVERKYKSMYNTPGHGVGTSAIGWGGDDADELGRYDETNQAFKEGHEIASHANCHFDGTKWTEAQWASEFSQFNKMIFNFLDINHLNPTPSFQNGWLFKKEDIKGFRAPLLGQSPALYKVLQANNFRYDTSKTAEPNYWPKKVAGVWNFPLAMLRVAGTGKKTLSMDYNFYYAQSQGKPDPGNTKVYEEQMYQTYMRYFQGNYNGNRAPIHIGHHFAQWNGGAYWRAMKRVASEVCGLPEVKCVTYKELADYMDKQSSSRIAANEAGNFQKAAPVQFASLGPAPIEANLKLDMSDDIVNAVVEGTEAHKVSGGNTKIQLAINGQAVDSSEFSVSQARKLTETGETAVLRATVVDEKGKELLSKTVKIHKVGTGAEKVSKLAEEDRALLGDLPEAHLDEVNEASW